MRTRHYSPRTEEAYLGWIRRFLRHRGATPLAFLLRDVLGLEGAEDLPRARGPSRKPTVLSRTEVRHVLRELSGVKRLVASLLYGSGLRLEECLSLRVKDVSFETSQITVRDGKGWKDPPSCPGTPRRP